MYHLNTKGFLDIMTSKLNLPAKKFFIKELQLCRRTVAERAWIFGVQFNDVKKCFKVVIVWIQGIVVQVDKDTNSIVIDDGTGLAQIQSVNSIPGGWDWITTGMHCMIIGEFLSNTLGLVVIEAMKVTSLEDRPLLEALWKLEVLDMFFNA